ncbi:hypothetical protein [Streptomyces sp. NPDC057617]|uniref:hypothetical protein n=1 Tax=Streptomyces sp. NPDC057617 TaxID=3346184 RepID=UPI0036B0576F
MRTGSTGCLPYSPPWTGPSPSNARMNSAASSKHSPNDSRTPPGEDRLYERSTSWPRQLAPPMPEGTSGKAVRAFETHGMFGNAVERQVTTRSLQKALAPIRKQIRKAAGQLRGLQGRGRPLIVVLDNPGARPMPFASPRMVLSAMYGDLTLQASIEPDGALGEFHAIAGRNGRRTSARSRLSAARTTRPGGPPGGSARTATNSAPPTARMPTGERRR